MRINVEISINDDQDYTEREARILSALQAHPSQGAAAVVAEDQPVKAAEPAKPAAAKKPTAAQLKAKKAAEDKAAAEAAAAEAAEAEAAEEEVDPLGDDDDAPTIADAVELATKLVSDGKKAKVVSALAEVGADRVKNIAEDKIAEFIELAQA
jgi:phage protein D